MSMQSENPTSAQRLAKIVLQRLESLDRAGISHLPKPCTKPESIRQAAPIAVPTPVAVAVASEPIVVEPPQAPPAPLPNLPTEDRAAALAAVARQVAACTRCEELARTRTQTVFGVGNPHTRLVFLGEAPGADEDRLGEPFVGAAGQLLTDIIVKAMKLRREDVYIMNILRCRPPGNRLPLPDEAANCREYLDAQLAILKPEFICCLGACAAHNLLGVDTPIGRMRGRFFDHQGAKVLCTYHPAYLLRTPSAKRQVWEDIKLLMAEMGLPVS